MPVSADVVLRTSFYSIATWLNTQQASTASDLVSEPQDMDTDSAAHSQSNGTDAVSTEHSKAQDEIIQKVLQELVFHSRAEVRLHGQKVRHISP